MFIAKDYYYRLYHIHSIDDMALVQNWGQGMASDCPNVGCSTVAGGLWECQRSCMYDFECTVINFCPSEADCKTNRCCLRNCNGDNYELTNKWKGWDVYAKGLYCFSFTYLTFWILVQLHITIHHISTSPFLL